MTTPEVQLSDALDTREDAVKIAHALWDEAQSRDWQRQYRQILDNAGIEGDIPTVGTASANFLVNIPLTELGAAGEMLKPVVTDANYVTITLHHSIEFDADPTGECICEGHPRDIARKVLEHMRETVPMLNEYGVNGQRNGNGEFIATSECSSPNCPN